MKIEGKEYGDCIHQESRVNIGLWDRIKILFGKPLIVSSAIYTKDECEIVHTKTFSYVPRIFKKKSRVTGEEITA